MTGHHLTLGAHLLLWVFPLALTAVSVLLELWIRPRPESRP